MSKNVTLQDKNGVQLFPATTAEQTSFDGSINVKQAIQRIQGSPLVASTASAMTDTSRVYIYTGSESGYTSGNWYYYNGSNWVSGGVYNAVAVVTDPTLTQEGVPADAKATGYIKTDLKGFEISTFYNTLVNRGKNLFNKDDPRNMDGYYRNASGELKTFSNTEVFLSHPIAVKGGTEYRAIRRNGTFGTNAKVYIVDSTGAILYGTFDGTLINSSQDENFIVFTPPYDCLVQLNLGRGSGSYTGYLKANCMVCASADMSTDVIWPDNYVPYVTENNTIISQEAKESAFLLDAVTSRNLFNKDDERVIGNANIGGNGIVTNSGTYVSHPIRVKKGATYRYTQGTGTGTNRNYIYLDGSLNPFPHARKAQQDPTFSTANVFTAELNGYVRINLGSDPSVIMFCESDNYGTDYSGYSFTMPHIKHPQLYGKIVSFNGDSICSGAGSSGGYGKIIAERNGMIYENIGVSGATITAGTYSESGAARHWICRTITDMRSDADYVILEGGVNDSVVSTIGTLTSGYTATLDDTTYAGAFESMLKQAINRFKGKKIGYIAVHKCSPTYSSNDDVSTDRYYIALAACKKWGIPVCDLNINCPPLAYIDDLKNIYTKDGDGWHPNEAGYKAFYCDKIEAWMATL